MGKVDAEEQRRRKEQLIEEIRAALAALQPSLAIVREEPMIVEGDFVLEGPEGPFDQFRVAIWIPDNFPDGEPWVFETADRIPRCVERHVFPRTGHCCLGVWEEWLIREPNPSFAYYLAGPVKSYFLSQCLFERDGTWRFGERSHERGILEAYADVLQLEPDNKRVDAYLAVLSQQWPKGHWPCPCGSGQRIRMCHRAQLEDLHRRIPPVMAGRMLSRLRQSLEP